jgi:hypothetical protein
MCASLKVAKGTEIVFWISQANAAAGKRVMMKNGLVEDKWRRLADYYGLNLSPSAMASTSVAPKTQEDHIKDRQFSWLRELGEEWGSAAADGNEFVLCEESSGEFIMHRDSCLLDLWADHDGGAELCSTSLLWEAIELLLKLAMHTPSLASTPLSLDG